MTVSFNQTILENNLSPYTACQSRISSEEERTHKSSRAEPVISFIDEFILSAPNCDERDEIQNYLNDQPQEDSNANEDPDTKNTMESSAKKQNKPEVLTNQVQDQSDRIFIFDNKTASCKCTLCSRPYNSKPSDIKHMAQVCQEKTFIKVSEVECDVKTNKFKCKVCGKSVESAHTTAAHKRDLCSKASLKFNVLDLPTSGKNTKQENIDECIETSNESESGSEKLLQQVSAENEDSIQKVFVTLSKQEEVVVDFDDSDGTVLQELPAFAEAGTSTQSSEQLRQYVEIGATDTSSSEPPNKRGRKLTNSDKYKFNQETCQYTCKNCDKNYKSKQSMMIHLTHCEKGKIIVETCSPSKTQVCIPPRKNLKNGGLEEKDGRYFTFDETRNQWTCKDCGNSYKTKPAVMKHKSKCRLSRCLYCDYKGRAPTNVRVHMMNKHNIIPRLNDDGTWIY